MELPLHPAWQHRSLPAEEEHEPARAACRTVAQGTATVQQEGRTRVIIDCTRRHRVHRVPVVDDRQRLVGVIAPVHAALRARPQPLAIIDLVGATAASMNVGVVSQWGRYRRPGR